MPRGQLGKISRRRHYARRSIQHMLRQRYITAVISGEITPNLPESENNWSD